MYMLKAVQGMDLAPGVLGQMAMGQVDVITRQDIATEFVGRGYYEEVTAPGVVVPVDRAITKAEAIALAVDVTIIAFENYYADTDEVTVRRTAQRPFRCPEGDYGCPFNADLWNRLMIYAVDIGNGYLTGRYSLPTWLSRFAGSLSGGTPGALSGIGDWLQSNPWVISTVGDALANYGEYLTAKNVEAVIKQQIPADLLKKEDLPALLAALQQGGAIQPGQAAIVQQGAAAATAPSWMMPAVIAGGALLVFMLMRK